MTPQAKVQRNKKTPVKADAKNPRVFMANTSGAVEIDGIPFSFHKDKTVVRDTDDHGKKVLEAVAEYFDPVEDKVNSGQGAAA